MCVCVIGDVAIGRLELSCLDHPFGRSEDDDDDDDDQDAIGGEVS